MFLYYISDNQKGAEVMEKVAIVKYDVGLDSLRRAIELCDGFEKLKTSDKILLKPNILWGGTR